MNKHEKSLITQILENVARIEERVKCGFEKSDEDLREIKSSVATINEEMGVLRDRVVGVEKLYVEAKARYDKMSSYWKVISFVISPVVTFIIMYIVQFVFRIF